MFDVHRRETLFVFDLHAVENAAIGVDADKEFLGGFEIFQCLRRVAHKLGGNLAGKSGAQSNTIWTAATSRRFFAARVGMSFSLDFGVGDRCSETHSPHRPAA